MDIVTLALAKKFTRDTADSLGSLKGAPCTIKSVVYQDGINVVTFEWEGASGAKQTAEIAVRDGISAEEATDAEIDALFD